ncbi:hypothetical protein V8C42DRAFT_339439 [Trichoderma barbatum]
MSDNVNHSQITKVLAAFIVVVIIFQEEMNRTLQEFAQSAEKIAQLAHTRHDRRDSDEEDICGSPMALD